MLKNIHFLISKMCVFSPQSCLTLCSPMNYSLPGSSDHGIFQARILEWGAFSFARGSSQPRDQNHESCVSCIGRQILRIPQRYCKATVIITMLYWIQLDKSREWNTEYRNRPTNTYKFRFLKKVQEQCNGKWIIFLINGVGVIGKPFEEKNEPQHHNKN